MNAGQLRDRITIKRETNTPDGTGGYDRSWSTVAEVWANIVSMNGREAVLGQVLQGISTFQITVRHRTDIEPAMQILWGTRELNVQSAEDKAGTRQWTTIIASTEAPQGA
jgi:SPP1 family predicted phage head-tail adaptor